MHGVPKRPMIGHSTERYQSTSRGDEPVPSLGIESSLSLEQRSRTYSYSKYIGEKD